MCINVHEQNFQPQRKFKVKGLAAHNEIADNYTTKNDKNNHFHVKYTDKIQVFFKKKILKDEIAFVFFSMEEMIVT